MEKNSKDRLCNFLKSKGKVIGSNYVMESIEGKIKDIEQNKEILK